MHADRVGADQEESHVLSDEGVEKIEEVGAQRRHGLSTRPGASERE